MFINKLRIVLIVAGCALTVGCATTSPIAKRQTKTFNQYFDEVKKTPDHKVLREILLAFPKGADLHTHLSSAAPVDDILEVAENFKYQAVFSKNGGTFYGFVQPTRETEFLKNCNNNQERKCIDISKLKDDEKKVITEALTIDLTKDHRTEKSQFKAFNDIFTKLDELSDNADVMPELVKRVMRIASEQNIAYLELMINPIKRTDSQNTVVKIEVLLDNLVKAVNEMNQDLSNSQKNQVAVRFIATVRRATVANPGGPTDLPRISDCSSRLTQLYFLAANHTKGVVGYNLVGLPEENIPCLLYQITELETKFKMKANLTLHAGETLEDSRKHHIEEAMNAGAKRIGHAFNLHRLPAAVTQNLYDKRIAIEVSLTSNLVLGLLEKESNDLSKHPFPGYLRGEKKDDGNRPPLPVTLNTDNAGIFKTDLTEEFVKAVVAFNLTWDEVKRLAETSLKYAFVEGKTRKKLMKSWKSEVKNFEEKNLKN